MGVEVYVWSEGQLKRVDVEFAGSEGIAISGVGESRMRALRDRIYSLAKRGGIDTGSIQVVVTPAIKAGTTEGVEVAALIAAALKRSESTQLRSLRRRVPVGGGLRQARNQPPDA